MSLLCTNCQRRFSHTGFTLHSLHTSNQGCRDAYRRSIVDQLLSDDEEPSDVDSAPQADDGSALLSDHSRDEVRVLNADEQMEIFYNPDSEALDHDWQSFTADECTANLFDDDADHSDVSLEDSDTDTNLELDELDIEDVPEDVDNLPLDAEVQARLRSADPEAADTTQDLPPPFEPDITNDSDIFIEPFARGRAGAPVEDRDIPAQLYYQNELHNRDNPFAPFTSKIDWEIARWAKTRNISSSALTDLLSIEGVRANVSLFFVGSILTPNDD